VRLFTRELLTNADTQRERRAVQTRQIMASGREELSRADLDFEAWGGRMVEHRPTGKFFNVFAGDPQYVGDDVTAFFVTDAGEAVLLQRGTPGAVTSSRKDGPSGMRSVPHAKPSTRYAGTSYEARRAGEIPLLRPVGAKSARRSTSLGGRDTVAPDVPRQVIRARPQGQDQAWRLSRP